MAQKLEERKQDLGGDENSQPSFGDHVASAYLWLYDFFYITGISLIRQTRGLVHIIIGFFSRLWDSVITGVRRFGYHIAFPFHEWMVEQKEQIRNIQRERVRCLESLKNAQFQSRRVTLLSALRLVWLFLLVVWKIFLRVLNYAAPIAAGFLFYFSLQYFSGLEFALNVNYSGENIGYIKDETVFHEAEQVVRNRTIIGDSEPLTNIIPSYSLVVVGNEELTDSASLADLLFKASGRDVIEASGLYIDGEFIGASDRPDLLLLALNEKREQYRDDDDKAKLEFVQKISVMNGLYPSSTLMNISDFQKLFNGEVAGEQYYTVEKGDAPSLIASEFDVPYADFLLMNPGVEEKLLVGDQVLISRSVPYLSVTTTKREVYAEDLPYTTDYTYDNNYYSTYAKVTKNGVDGEQEITALVTYLDGQVINRQILSSEVLVEAVTREVTAGTKNPINAMTNAGNSGTSSKGFIWPTPGGYVSCGIWGYWGHTGMDITGTGWGSNIYAAASGTVVASGWGGAYGNYIIINHGNGVQTLYAHNSDLYVRVGQYVNQGDVIAAMGASGNASGTHLHFEVRINGQYVNPAMYF